MADVVASPAAAFHPHPSVGSEHATMFWRVFCRPPSQCPTLFDDGRFAFVVGGIVLEAYLPIRSSKLVPPDSPIVASSS